MTYVEYKGFDNLLVALRKEKREREEEEQK